MSRLKLHRLTLRDKCRDAVQLSRDLIDHLEHGEIPKAHRCHRILEKADEEVTMSDSSVRDLTAAVLDSESFTAELFENFDQYLEAIGAEVEQVLNGSEPDNQ